MPEAKAEDALTPPARPRFRAFLLGLCHSVLMMLALPPTGWWPMAFVAPLPLFLVSLRPGPSAMAAGFWTMLGVAPFWIWSHAWIAGVSAAGVYPLVVYLSLYAWAFVWIASRATRGRAMPAAATLVIVWCGLEYFRGAVAWSGYPWYLLGHPMIDSPGAALAWPASVGGVTLVSALTAIPAALVASRGRNPVWLRIGSGIALSVWIGVGVPWSSLPHAQTSSVRVAVVQTNVPQDNRIDWTPMQRLADWQTMREQIVQAARTEPPPDLIVMPEGLVPGWTFDPESLRHERERGIVWLLKPQSEDDQRLVDVYGERVPATRVVDELLALQRAVGIPMLVGSVAYDNLRIVSNGDGLEYENDAMYNTVYLVEGGRVGLDRYDKLHLTPFGEVLPYISAWPWLEQRLLSIGAEGMMFALSPGHAPRTIPLHTDAGRIDLATPICFEATMAGVTRRLANQIRNSLSPGLLINVTNDGWFGRSDRGRVMHELSSRWRCVELGMPMVRCANTGISGFFDARGRTLATLAPRQPGTLAADLSPAHPDTLFAQTGEWPGWLCVGAIPILLLLAKARNSAEPVPPTEGTE
ncbi:MAG: apolipoprotein N-acyltransferase [Planctomycetota bacterium]|nr:MAG: apolipoprotein N-acyltransferase [Planctomycetota bacterium]